MDWLTGSIFLAAPGLDSIQTWLGIAIAAAEFALGFTGFSEFMRRT